MRRLWRMVGPSYSWAVGTSFLELSLYFSTPISSWPFLLFVLSHSCCSNASMKRACERAWLLCKCWLYNVCTNMYKLNERVLLKLKYCWLNEHPIMLLSQNLSCYIDFISSGLHLPKNKRRSVAVAPNIVETLCMNCEFLFDCVLNMRP